MNFIDFNPIIVNCCYVIFVIFAVSFNGLFIFLVKFRSPGIVLNMKIMLINTSIIQILIAFMAGFLQGRMLPVSSETAFLPVGPCRMFDRMICFITYNVLAAFTLYVELLVLHTMFWRYRMLRYKELRTAELLLSVVIISILPMIVLFLPNIAFPFFDVVMKDAIHEHPYHDLQKYGEFGGFQPITHPIEAVTSLISFASALSSPIVMICLKRLILKRLNSKRERHSERTVRSSKMFMKALTAQAMVPILCFLPMNLLYLVIKFFGSDTVLVFTEYLIVASITFPCVVDPLLAIYFVPSYRTWVRKRFIYNRNHLQVSAVNAQQKAITISKPAQ